MKHEGEICQCMASDRERHLGCLRRTPTGSCGNGERARIEHCGQRGEPVLVQVLRAVVGESGVGEMGLHQLSRPVLPLTQTFVEALPAAALAQALQQRAGGGR